MKTPNNDSQLLETDWIFSEDDFFRSSEDRQHAVTLFLPTAMQKLQELLDKGAGCGAWTTPIKLSGQRIWLFCRRLGGKVIGFGVGPKPFVDQLFDAFENEQIAKGLRIYSTTQES